MFALNCVICFNRFGTRKDISHANATTCLESSANDSDRSGNFALDFHMIPETAVSSRQEILRKHVLNRKTDFCECCYESPFFVFLQRI